MLIFISSHNNHQKLLGPDVISTLEPNKQNWLNYLWKKWKSRTFIFVKVGKFVQLFQCRYNIVKNKIVSWKKEAVLCCCFHFSRSFWKWIYLYFSKIITKQEKKFIWKWTVRSGEGMEKFCYITFLRVISEYHIKGKVWWCRAPYAHTPQSIDLLSTFIFNFLHNASELQLNQKYAHHQRHW